MAFLQRLIQAPGGPGQEGPCARLIGEQMEAMGYHRVEVDELGNVIGTVRGTGSGSILFDGHMDTVPAEPERWSRDPFGGEVDGGRIWGRGTTDMRGALAAALFAVGRLARDSGALGTVHVCASVCEEAVEGTALVHALRRRQPERVVIMEPSGLDIAVGQRGRAELLIETIGRSAHSSAPRLGVNAVTLMQRVLGELEGLELPEDPLLGPAILVVTDILSEPYPGLSVLPHGCRVTADRRLLVGETSEHVLGQIEAILARLAEGDPDFSGRVTIAEDRQPTYNGGLIVAPNFSPAWKIDPEEPLVTGAVAALRQIGQQPALGTYRFCTNGSGSAGVLGVPTIGYGPGHEETAHTVDEYLELDQLFSAAEGYAALAARLT